MSNTAGLHGLQTEARNSRSKDIDNVPTTELCEIINTEDATVATAVQSCIPTIAAAIDALTPRLREGGRIIYVGAGTSGRLGVLDASEIPPTFSASPVQFVALIAGGDGALRSAKEGAEDSQEAAVRDLEPLNLDGEKDSLIGIAASGRTPYVLSSLAFAKARGCITIGVACSFPSAMGECGHVDFNVAAVTGAEVVTGSTRMKAGTATKLVLNMISTGVMIKTGKTFGNIMIDVKPTNVKLQDRARRILREICGERCPAADSELDNTLNACGNSVKLAASVIHLGVSVEEAKQRLLDAGGVLANILKPRQTSRRDAEHTGDTANPEFVLCVDGGGTKCKAVIIASDGTNGVGEAGPCNPTESGVEPAVAEMRVAIRKAVEACPSAKGAASRQLRFVDVWIGLAGCDRNGLDMRIRSHITELLGLTPLTRLSVTNDIELQATVAGTQTKTIDVIVLVAGTGSAAMHYCKDGDEYSKIARSGGWGALLGDEGSGFDIGREAVRIALRRLELQNCSILNGKPSDDLDPLFDIILHHYAPTASSQKGLDLLTAVMMPHGASGPSTTQAKQRIASAAKVVIEAAAFSLQAKDILDSALQSLATQVLQLCRRPGVQPQDTTLVVVGGLMQAKTMREGLQRQLDLSNTAFKRVLHLEQPAFAGAQLLSSKAWQKADYGER